ncbi:MAG TPA: CBS domain-containing protein [Clostridiales bacterium]|jgi:CBS domain-containing protein|nr:CBS domain-containing protein [Clostridiales bacterium]
MQVYQLMNTNVISISGDGTAAEAARLLRHYDIGALPVTGEDGRLRGIITDRDILIRCVATDKNPAETPVANLMTRSVVTVPADADVREAASLMSSNQVRRLPVTKNGGLVGILSIGDIARARSCDMEAALALAEISEPTEKKR